MFFLRYFVITILLLSVSGSAQRPWPNTAEMIKKVCYTKKAPTTYGANEFVESRGKDSSVVICRWQAVCCEDTKH
jgi:hypothetical protein